MDRVSAELLRLPPTERVALALELRSSLPRLIDDTVAEVVNDEGGRDSFGAMARAARQLGLSYRYVVASMDRFEDRRAKREW